jgi:S-adenosylmethionine decarboxylase
MIQIFITLIALCVQNVFGEGYSFRGKHFIASYLDCDREAIEDVELLLNAMDQSVIASGATLLSKSSYVFTPNGLTVVYLLSESHASLHTYPEHGTCFVDLFTCGEKCSAENFDAMLQAYLKPKKVNARLFIREEDAFEFKALGESFEKPFLVDCPSHEYSDPLFRYPHDPTYLE